MLHIKRFILKWKTSLIAVGAMVLLGVLALLLFPSLPPSEPAGLNEDTVVISVAGEEKLRVPLSQPQTVTIEQKDGRKNIIVVTEDGAYLLDTTSIQFSVNKDCGDLDMTNEFMRFLMTSAELNKMAEIKRLVSPTTDLSYDNIYASLGGIPSERTVSPEQLQLLDDATIQLRSAAYRVMTGEMTIDEAVAGYGSLE